MERKIAFIDPFIDEIIDKDIFEASCPYYKPGFDNRPLYRLIQTFDDKPSQYVGDSFGGRTYINVNVPRHCSQSCACHSLEASGRYVFTVFKNSTTMVIEFHCDHLSSWLAGVLPIAHNETSNGLLLLKHLDRLENCFRAFQETKRWFPHGSFVALKADRLEQGLILLIESLLNDPQVFTSFGFQRLYDEEYLSYERWKQFHSSWTKENIDLLEASYSDDYEDQDLSHPSSHNPQKESQDTGDQSRWIRLLSEWIRSELDCTPTMLCHAAREGHEKFLRRQLKLANSLEGPEKFTPCLEKISLTKALLEAINNGHENIVSLLLDHGAEIDGTGSTKPELGLPLRSAVYAGNSNVINLLLSRGAKIGNVWLEDTTDHWLIAKSLINHGVDPHHLAISLKSHSNKSADKGLVNFILRVAVNTQQRTLRRFHSAFRQEFLRVTRCAQLWIKEYCGHRRKAFEDGLSVLRGLCKGQLPSTLNETIWFLAIAKAMSYATRNISPRNYEQSQIPLRLDERSRRYSTFGFSGDLGRWQILFQNDPRSLAQYKMAIASIWHVNLDGTRVLRPDPSTLKEFCDLAYGILQNLDHSFNDSSHGSGRLLASQEQWRVHTCPTPHAEIHPEQTRKSNEGPPPVSCSTHHFARYKDREPLPLSVPDIPIRQAISNDQRLWSTKPLVQLLMAGAIFGIVVTFLLGLLIDQRNPQSSISSTSEGSLFHGQKQSMINAVEHMLKADVSEIQPARQAIESIKRAAYTAIETAQLRTFQDLKNFLGTQDFSHVSPTEHGCRHFRDCLIQACILWEPSYALQERYQVLESYLGLSHTLTIVPNTPRPRLYAQILETEKPTEGTTTSDDGPSLVKSPVSSPISISSSSVDAVDSSMELPTLTSSPRLEAPPQQPKRSLPLQKTFCKDCNHDFEKICRYRRHRREKHEKVRFSCRVPPCLKTFSRNDYRDKHETRRHADRS